MTSTTLSERALGAAALFWWAGLAGTADAAAADAARLARADAVVRAEMRVERIPGLAIAIVDHGKVVLARGYGYANVEHSVPVTVDTVFQSGSVGKQFTAAAVMLLVQDGRLSLDDPVTRYVPEAPPEWSAIRIRHLLTHTAGIPDYRTRGPARRHAPLVHRAGTGADGLRVQAGIPARRALQLQQPGAICCSAPSSDGWTDATTATCSASGSSAPSA